MHALPEGGEGPEGVLTDAASPEPDPRPAPLAGTRVLVTRPVSGAEALARQLVDAGATAVTLPTVRIDDPPDSRPLRAAAAHLDSYAWIVLTSPNAVSRLAAAMSDVPGGREAFRSARIAAIGSATADAVRREGGTPTLVPDTHTGEALAEALRTADPGLEGSRVLLARSAIARSVLPERLEAAGAIVDDVPAYTTSVEEASGPPLHDLLEAGGTDWIAFASSSAVTAWVELVGRRTGGARIAAIGPVTAATVREQGLPEPVVAREHSADGLVDAIAAAVQAISPAGAP